MELIRAEPTAEDARLVHRWRQDPEALAASFHDRPEPFETFYPRYLLRYFGDPQLPPYFLHVDSKRVGFVGFDREGELSIVIAPEKRRKGHALAALLALKPRLVRAVFARVKESNEQSIALFEKAGFTLKGRTAGVLHFILDYKRAVSVIAEIGSNWREDDGSMIARAAEAGVDAVKFQLFQAKRTYAPNSGRAGYLPEKEISDLFDDVALPPEKIPALAEACAGEGVEFLCSVFSPEEVALVDPFVKRHKLASYEISHLPLIHALAQTGKPLLMSTGASSLEEVGEAVDFYFSCGGKELTLMQCTACYPAPLSAMNLQALQTLQNAFALPVGLSDHSEDPLIAPVMAVALGAVAIEKHFTLSKSLPGPDHPFAVTPKELKALVKAIRFAETARGSGVKRVLAEEEELYRFAKRRIQALVSIKKGEEFLFGKNIDILRPGVNSLGAHPRALEDIIGRKAARNIEAGEGVTRDDLA